MPVKIYKPITAPKISYKSAAMIAISELNQKNILKNGE